MLHLRLPALHLRLSAGLLYPLPQSYVPVHYLFTSVHPAIINPIYTNIVIDSIYAIISSTTSTSSHLLDISWRSICARTLPLWPT